MLKVNFMTNILFSILFFDEATSCPKRSYCFLSLSGYIETTKTIIMFPESVVLILSNVTFLRVPCKSRNS